MCYEKILRMNFVRRRSSATLGRAIENVHVEVVVDQKMRRVETSVEKKSKVSRIFMTMVVGDQSYQKQNSAVKH